MDFKMNDLFIECNRMDDYLVEGETSYKFKEYDDGTLILYLAGSNKPVDWIRNFWFFPKRKKPFKDMVIGYKCHAGFLSAYKQIQDIFIKKITEVTTDKKVFSKRKNKKVTFDKFKRQLGISTETYKWKKIIVVGYSHGAGIAPLPMDDAWFWRPDLAASGNIIGYAFEAPRVFAQWYIKKELRERWSNLTIIRNRTDLVTHVPPILFKFRHVNKITKIKGDLELAPAKKHTPKCIKAHYPQPVSDGLIKYENK